MATVLILEDEKYTLEFLELFVGKHPLVDKVIAVNNSNAAVTAAKDYLPQIALLDIELCPDDPYDGIQTAKIISKISPDTTCVFLTGYGKYALDGYTVQPYDYILKPIKKEKLTETITEILSKNADKHTNRITFKGKEGTIILNPDSIACIEKQNRKTLIYAQQNIYQTNNNLNELESLLPQQFWRAHNSFIINIERILMIKYTSSRSYQITFDNCTAIAWMSRQKYEEYKKLFSR